MKGSLAIFTIVCLQLAAVQFCICDMSHTGEQSPLTHPCCAIDPAEKGSQNSDESCPHCEQMAPLVMGAPLKAISAPGSKFTVLLSPLPVLECCLPDRQSIAAQFSVLTDYAPPLSGGTSRAVLGVFLI